MASAVASSITALTATTPPKALRGSQSKAREYAATRSLATAAPQGLACLTITAVGRSPKSWAKRQAASASIKLR